MAPSGFRVPGTCSSCRVGPSIYHGVKRQSLSNHGIVSSTNSDVYMSDRFAYVDYCMCSGLAPYFTLCRHCSGYDINCQYRIHFKTCIEELQAQFPTLSTFQIMFFPYTLPAIGKFHAPAHTSSCRTAYSYNFLPGVGMTDGEALERIWSVFNALASRTKEMSSGHRHDVINDFHSDMNVRRLHAICMYHPSCIVAFINNCV